MQHPSTTREAGFTLVELSIVIVIIGMLVGGVLMGQNLIRNADLQTVVTDAAKYKAAAKQFKDKYLALPGDFSEATSIWGDDAAACADGAITDGNPGTCNGDGDGYIESAAGNGQTGEQFQFWKQLQLEGLIKGDFSGLSGSTGTYDNVPGTNSPKGKITSTGWSTYTFFANSLSGNAFWFDGLHGNLMVFGALNRPSITSGVAFKPEEAWGIDTKIDDGKPGTGEMITLWHTGCSTATASNQYLTVQYDLDNTAIACQLEFIKAF